MPLNPLQALALPRSPLPPVTTMADELGGALQRGAVLPQDLAFAQSLLQAVRSNRATDRQLEYFERLWTRYCDPMPLPADTLRACEMVEDHATTQSAERRHFIESIVHAVRGRAPTLRQWEAFLTLHQAAQTDAAATVEQAAVDAATADRVDATRLFAMFRNALAASTGATAPRLRFPGLSVWLSQRGDTAGQLMLTRPHADPARRTRLARVAEDGRILGGFNHRPSMLSVEQRQLLNRLCENPEDTLATEGRRTGVCCMCGRGLTDERSVNLGMGPVCANRWGLSAQWLSARGVSPTGRTIAQRPAALAAAPSSSPVGDMLRAQQRGPVVNGEIVPNAMLSPHAPPQEDF